MSEEATLRAECDSDPGGEPCVRLAGLLRERGRALEAIDVCLAGLSANPQNYQARLLLARLLSERGYYAFASREVHELLAAFPESEPLRKLIGRLCPESKGETSVLLEPSGKETLAEAEIDFGDLEELAREQAAESQGKDKP